MARKNQTSAISTGTAVKRLARAYNREPNGEVVPVLIGVLSDLARKQNLQGTNFGHSGPVSTRYVLRHLNGKYVSDYGGDNATFRTARLFICKGVIRAYMRYIPKEERQLYNIEPVTVALGKPWAILTEAP